MTITRVARHHGLSLVSRHSRVSPNEDEVAASRPIWTAVALD